MPAKPIIRCFGDDDQHQELARYHDEEWGIPKHDDRQHFEMLILEGAQAGLNWEIVLKKREGYRRAFHQFDVEAVAAMTDADLEALREDTGIIRNKLKIYATRRNAQAFIEIQREFGSFDSYVWPIVGGSPIKGNWRTRADVPATTKESDALSKDLKKRGMTFVGSTIIYAYMQAAGLVNDHFQGCHLYTP